jgi:hypothetical protein
MSQIKENLLISFGKHFAVCTLIGKGELYDSFKCRLLTGQRLFSKTSPLSSVLWNGEFSFEIITKELRLVATHIEQFVFLYCIFTIGHQLWQ